MAGPAFRPDRDTPGWYRPADYEYLHDLGPKGWAYVLLVRREIRQILDANKDARGRVQELAGWQAERLEELWAARHGAADGYMQVGPAPCEEATPPLISTDSLPLLDGEGDMSSDMVDRDALGEWADDVAHEVDLGRRLLTINLDAPEDTIRDTFDGWLRARRRERSEPPPPRRGPPPTYPKVATVTPADLERWARNRIIPLRDLEIGAAYAGNDFTGRNGGRFTRDALNELLFGKAAPEDAKDKIGKVQRMLDTALEAAPLLDLQE